MSLGRTLDWMMVRDSWRAHVGRLPRAHEAKVRDLTRLYGGDRMLRAIGQTRDSGLRRTADRWGFFLALFGESP